MWEIRLKKLYRMEDNFPMVSIHMITYNHEKYIEQAIEGVLMQECNFNIELIIANDKSPDETDKVVRNIMNTHSRSSSIKYFSHKNNLGIMANFKFALEKCKGKYIAICEGDDYWTDPLKLQKQVQFLENNPDYNASFHDVDVLFEDKAIKFSDWQNSQFESSTIGFDDIIATDWLIPTCSSVFRNEKVLLPDFISDFNYVDFPLFSGLALNSKFHYFSDVMAVYRKDNINSVTNNKNFFKNVKKSVDYTLFLNWLQKFASKEEQTKIDERFQLETKRIYSHLNSFENSRFIKLYYFLLNKVK